MNLLPIPVEPVDTDECVECDRMGCVDGLIPGFDCDGRETEDKCLHRCHMTEEQTQIAEEA